MVHAIHETLKRKGVFNMMGSKVIQKKGNNELIETTLDDSSTMYDIRGVGFLIQCLDELNARITLDLLKDTGDKP
jgi:hypothetical protein